MNLPRFGNLEIGSIPRVVGSIATAKALGRVCTRKDSACDVAEVRWDLIGTGKAVFQMCRKIQANGTPVILTIRSSREGGKWTGCESRRLELYTKALPYVSAVDVEISSPIFKSVVKAAHKARKPVIGSFHDFEKTPDVKTLCDVIRKGRSAGADVVKLATFINRPGDIAVLFRVLGKRGRKPLCLIGMGRRGMVTRVSLACAGSCLTYGYVDRTAAPGQIPSRVLMRRVKYAGCRSRP